MTSARYKAPGAVRWILTGLLLPSLAGLTMLAAPGITGANTITVNSEVEITFLCSLRKAIFNHNTKSSNNDGCDAGSGDDEIVFAEGITDLFLNEPLPAISNTLEILGVRPGEQPVTLHGAYFTVNAGATFTLSSVTEKITGLDFRSNQSLIVNNGGNLTVQSSGLSNANPDSLMPGFGGAIDNEGGVAAVNNTDITNSLASRRGGAIYNNRGTVRFDNEGFEISGNQAPRGGAIYNHFGVVVISSYFFSISGNSASTAGGGIYTEGGRLKMARDVPPPNFLTRADIVSNQAPTGGGIYTNGSRLSLSGIEINGNSASNGGNGAGLVIDHSANAAISQSYFHDNNAANHGGAIYNTNGSVLGVIASTFANDIAQDETQTSGPGAAIFSDGQSQLTILNCTFLGLFPEQDPEDVIVDSGSATIINSTIVSAVITGVSLRNSILADVHCFNSDDDGYNLQFGDVAGCERIPLADPALDPQGLQFNGGPTPTIMILKGSHAIDAVPLAACTNQNGKRLKVDQRGFTRPAPKHKACDIGAFERGAVQSQGGVLSDAQ